MAHHLAATLGLVVFFRSDLIRESTTILCRHTAYQQHHLLLLRLLRLHLSHPRRQLRLHRLHRLHLSRLRLHLLHLRRLLSGLWFHLRLLLLQVRQRRRPRRCLVLVRLQFHQASPARLASALVFRNLNKYRPQCEAIQGGLQR